MFKVIDTIDYRNSWIHRYPEWLERGEGVLVILDPNQITQPPDVRGRTVTIHKLGGVVNQLIAYDSEAPHSMVGIFFKNVFSDEIPKGSELEW